MTDWLGTSGTTTFTFTKQGAPIPLVSVVGGVSQSFVIANGVTLSTVVDKTTVCNGKADPRCPLAKCLTGCPHVCVKRCRTSYIAFTNKLLAGTCQSWA